MIFTKRIRYRFGDIDHAGIAYYPGLLHCFHCVFEDWWSDGVGLPYPRLMAADRLGLPAVRLEVDFFAPVRYGDEPVVHLGVLRVGRSSVEFGFWMTKDGAPPLLNRARITTVAVDMDTMARRDVPQDLRERLAGFALAEADFPPSPRTPRRSSGQRGSGRNARGK